jgi:hypothetical protein
MHSSPSLDFFSPENDGEDEGSKQAGPGRSGASKPAPGEASAMDGGWTTAGPILRNHPPKHADRCARRIFRRLPSPCRRTDGRITHDAQTERALISHTNGTVATGSVDDKKRVAYVVTHHLPTCQAIVSWMA